jgi:oxygen-independent coproporphyrinogen-3 oxidase
VADAVAYVRMIDEQGHAEVESETIEGETLMHELILMQLRLNEGLSIAGFRQRTGEDPVALFGAALTEAVARAWVSVSECQIALTRAGRLVANRVINELASAIPDRFRSAAG